MREEEGCRAFVGERGGGGRRDEGKKDECI